MSTVSQGGRLSGLCRVNLGLIGVEADEEQIGLGEVVSYAQKRLAGDGGDRVCAAVAEVQRGGMPALSSSTPRCP
jgi:hypothetical protein